MSEKITNKKKEIENLLAMVHTEYFDPTEQPILALLIEIVHHLYEYIDMIELEVM